MRISDWSSDVCSSDLVAGDHHVARPGALGDPVVGGVEAGAHHHPLHERMHRQRDNAVGHHLHGPAVTLGDLEDLLLHRTGVGVDVDGAGLVAVLAYGHVLATLAPRPVVLALARLAGGAGPGDAVEI